MRITHDEISAWAHCEGTPGCEGESQQPVPAIRETFVRVFGEDEGLTTPTTNNPLGGMVENSWQRLRFANEADVPCPHCGRDRAVADQVRPIYPSAIFGQNGQPLDQRQLLRLRAEGKIVSPGAGAPASDEMAALKAQVEALQGVMAQAIGDGPKRRPAKPAAEDA